MLNFKKSIQALALTSFSVTVFAAPLGVAAFSIVPFSTNTTVESVGQTSVLYTVTNNATVNIPNVSVVPNWNSAGTGLSLSNDTCSGQILAPGSAHSCSFDVVISGANQPSTFTIQPKVCGFNGQVCSQAISTASVNVIQHPLPLRVYEVISNLANTSQELVGINTVNTSDVIRADLQNPSGANGPLAISPNGQTVYMSYKSEDDTYRVLVFNVTANSLTQSGASYSLTYEGNSLINPGQMIITPDGNTLYITNQGDPNPEYPIYRIDLSNPNYSAAVSGISDGTGGLAGVLKAMVVSPDGKTVYVSNAYPSGPREFNYIFSFPNSSTTTSLSTIAKETDLTTIPALLISSDGRFLYATGQLPDEFLPAAIEQFDIQHDFELNNTFNPAPTTNGIISIAALSPNGTNIYSIGNPDSSFLLYSINTTNMSFISTVYPYHSIFGVGNYNYLSYSPDGSVVCILNYGASGNLTALFNPNSPSSVTTVNPASGDTSMYSHTWGNFIN